MPAYREKFTVYGARLKRTYLTRVMPAAAAAAAASLEDYARPLSPAEPTRAPVIVAVLGTSMNSGKTSTGEPAPTPGD